MGGRELPAQRRQKTEARRGVRKGLPDLVRPREGRRGIVPKTGVCPGDPLDGAARRYRGLCDRVFPAKLAHRAGDQVEQRVHALQNRRAFRRNPVDLLGEHLDHATVPPQMGRFHSGIERHQAQFEFNGVDVQGKRRDPLHRVGDPGCRLLDRPHQDPIPVEHRVKLAEGGSQPVEGIPFRARGAGVRIGTRAGDREAVQQRAGFPGDLLEGANAPLKHRVDLGHDALDLRRLQLQDQAGLGQGAFAGNTGGQGLFRVAQGLLDMLQSLAHGIVKLDGHHQIGHLTGQPPGLLATLFGGLHREGQKAFNLPGRGPDNRARVVRQPDDLLQSRVDGAERGCHLVPCRPRRGGAACANGPHFVGDLPAGLGDEGKKSR